MPYRDKKLILKLDFILQNELYGIILTHLNCFFFTLLTSRCTYSKLYTDLVNPSKSLCVDL